MEIKHTIEILTKDIQDIENLVRNLKNYPVPPRIEIDLAMDKLRQVYDLLHMIAQDTSASQPVTEIHSEKPAQEVLQSELSQERSVSTEAETVTSMEKPVSTETETETPMEKPVATETQPDAPAGEPAKEAPPQMPSEKPASIAQEEAREENQEAVRKASILAEKFAAEKSLNEKIAPGSGKDLSSRIGGEPIDSIRRHIGINDRFLIIRELLGGDNERYDQFIRSLDGCSGFQEAYGMIESEFSGRMDHEGVELLVRLARRRYVSTHV